MNPENSSLKFLQVKKVIKKPNKFKTGRSREIEFGKLREAKIKILHTPPRMIAFSFSYRIPGDIYIDDHMPNTEIFECMMCKLKHFKKISYAFHDREKQIIGCEVSDIGKPGPPIELLISRLQTLGNIHAYHLSITIEKVVTGMNQLAKAQCETKNERITDKESYKQFLKQSEILIQTLSSKGPIVICRGSNSDDFLFHPLIQIAFNYEFINLTGEDIESFALRLLKKGIPECIWIDRDYFQTLDIIVNQVFFCSQLEERIGYIIQSRIKRIRTQSTPYVVKFNDNNYSELFLIEALEINSNDLLKIKCKPQGSSMKGIAKQDGHYITNMTSFNLILENNGFHKEESSMIKSYYPNLNINYSESRTKEKVRCGVKLISKEF